ncbi:hypothetical protein [Sporosarcina ureae]|uniref:hypothetical protein n=1 Tax=Sporosarcina ureae TaxID=1571 RepID=UPI0028AE4103|nr:hypothetical protein [Sporosarcina ureae]
MKEIEFAKVEKAVKEIIHQTSAKITDVAFYYDPEEERYLIIHNFYNRIFSDDDFARLVSNILYEKLDQQGIEHYDFYSDDDMLAQLTMSYQTIDAEENPAEISFLVLNTEDYSVAINLDNMILEKLESNMLLSA